MLARASRGEKIVLSGAENREQSGCHHEQRRDKPYHPDLPVNDSIFLVLMRVCVPFFRRNLSSVSGLTAQALPAGKCFHEGNLL
jgi:hypothetical protein